MEKGSLSKAWKWAVIGFTALTWLAVAVNMANPAGLTSLASSYQIAGGTDTLLETTVNSIGYGFLYIFNALGSSGPLLGQVADAGMWGLGELADGAEYLTDSFGGADEYDYA